MGNIVGEPFKDYVAKQINVRQEVHGSGKTQNRTPEQIQYLNARNAWVKLASGTSMEQSRLDMIFGPGGNSDSLLGTGLARNFILFNGVRSLNENINQTKVDQSIASRDDEIASANGGLFTQNNIPVYTLNSITDEKIQSLNSTYSWGAQRSGIGSGGAYGLGGNEFGQVPMPGIESVNITNLDRGALKKATIQLKAHNKQQFDIIDALYLRLGYTILLEYGDSNYFDNNKDYTPMGPTLIEKEFFRPVIDNKPYLTLLNLIEKEREAKAGNYGGLFGKITNFKWTFNPDGSYSITLDVLSLGDVVESLKVKVAPFNFPLTNSAKEEIKELDTLDAKRYNNQLFSTLYSIKQSLTSKENQNPTQQKQILANEEKLTIDSIVIKQTDNRSKKDKSNSFQNLLQSLSVEGSLADLLTDIPDLEPLESGIYNVGKIFKPTIGFSTLFNLKNSGKVDFIQSNIQPNDYSWFIRLEVLLELIEKTILPGVVGGNGELTPQISLDYKETNLCFWVPNLISSDPTCCIISGKVNKGYNNIDDVFPTLEPFPFTQDNNTYGKLMNIYINFNFIIDLLSRVDDNGDIVLMSFLRNLCNGINKSLGGVNKIEPKIYEEENSIKFVDQTPLPGKENLSNEYFPTGSESYIFDLYGYNTKNKTSNFIHNIGLTTEITPEYATMITIGSTANGYAVGEDATSFSKWNTGIVDRFKQEISQPLPPTNNTSSLDKYNTILQNYYQVLNADPTLAVYSSPTSFFQNTNYSDPFLYLGFSAIYTQTTDFGTYFGQSISFDTLNAKLTPGIDSNQILTINFDSISSNQSTYTEFYKLLQAKASFIEKNLKSSGQTGFLPFNLQLDMDGIEGMRIYNKIKVDSKFLPTNYPEKLEFVLTGVRHKLENNQWVTNLDSIATVNNLLTTVDLTELFSSIIQSFPGNEPVAKALATGLSKNVSTSILNPNSNANKLRKTIKSLPNVTEKGVEIDNGGDITKNMQIATSAVLRKIAELYPDYKIEITGGNDYHHQIKAPNSRHTKGQGIDFVIIPRKSSKETNETFFKNNKTKLDNIVNILNKFCVMNQGPNTVFGYIDEYREPSGKASGLHFHMAIGNNTYPLSGTAARVAKKATKKLGTKFVSLTEPNVPLSQEELQSLYSGYKLNFM